VSSRPTKAFYPDPIARFVRVEPMVLQQDLSKYIPWRQDKDVISSKVEGDDASYLDFQWIDKWPFVSPIRIIARAAGADQPLRVKQDWMPELKSSVPVLYVDVPAGWTVALRLTAAACLPPHPPEDRSRLARTMMALAPKNANSVLAELPAGVTVSLFQAFNSAVEPTPVPAPRFLAAAAGGVGRMAFMAPIAGARPVPASPQPAPQRNSSDFKDRRKGVVGNVTAQTFVSGTTHYVTPPRILTLVHAVRKPHAIPDFSGDTHGSEFSVLRRPGENSANVTTKFSAHWLSTAKIACRGSWCDTIDDPSKPDLKTRPSSEIAFEFVNAGGPETSGKNAANFRAVSAVHQFRDTRAHKVTYSLSAYTRFREYYPRKVGFGGVLHPEK
jgi:hypothetical protein